MNTTKFFLNNSKVLEPILSIPSHLQVVYNDLFKIQTEVSDSIKEHLQHTINWLTYAQDVNQDDGVSAGYSFVYGWLSSYPETTGYIIPTLLRYYHFTNKEEYRNRAIRMADWLVSIQLQNGAFHGGQINERPKPIVFNTGQVLQGLLKMYKVSEQRKYLQAAIRAANWLVKVQDEDGAWRKFTYNRVPHVYHTRVAWPLLELYQLTSDEVYLNAAFKNIKWALDNQDTNGWFRNNTFTPKGKTILHAIAYVIEGLLECADLLQNKAWLEAAIKPAEVLLRDFEMNGNLSGAYNDKWKGIVGYRCLTGEAQMSVCWLRLFQLNRDKRYLNGGLNINKALMVSQNNASRNAGIRGGVKGSHPIWGRYHPFTYPNWAAKFFVDALMAEISLVGER